MHRTTALSILEAAGVKRQYRVMTEARTRRAITLYESGMSFANIGSILEYSQLFEMQLAGEASELEVPIKYVQ